MVGFPSAVPGLFWLASQGGPLPADIRGVTGGALSPARLTAGS
jgi:hypothetical protein